jgi:hypothetical protein
MTLAVVRSLEAAVLPLNYARNINDFAYARLLVALLVTYFLRALS